MPFKRCCKLAFCRAARLAIVYPSPSRWQYQARLPLFQTLIGCLPANIMEDALLQKPCFHHMYTCTETGSVSCLACNFSIQKLKKKRLQKNKQNKTLCLNQFLFVGFYSLVTTWWRIPLTTHWLYVSVQQPAMEKHCLTVCPALPLPNWVGRPWRLEMWIVDAGWKKLVCCGCHRKRCQTWFICRENASYKSQHASVRFSLDRTMIECIAVPNYCWFWLQELWHAPFPPCPAAITLPFGFCESLLIFASELSFVLDEWLCAKDDIYYIL